MLTFISSAGAADYAQAGALAVNGNWEVSVVFNNTVSPGSVADISNYFFPPHEQVQIDNIRYQPLDNAVVLTVSGLATNSPNSLTVSNIKDTAGATLPPATLSFTTKPISWTAVGGQQFGFAPDAVAVGDTGFDLISGGVLMHNSNYDESTFAYETLTGDFDRKVRVAFQEPSSTDAIAGLMVRETLDAERPAPADSSDPAQAFSRYFQVQVAPSALAYQDEFDQPANDYGVTVRRFLGGSSLGYSETLTTDTNAPAYPNAWLRLKRVGQTFYAFRGTDGTNWVSLGTFSFPASDDGGNQMPPFGNNVFVGPNYTPETANIPPSTGERRAFMAQFRDYGLASGDVPVGYNHLSIVKDGNQVELSWSGPGTLQSSTNLNSTVWADLGSSFPIRVTADKKAQFFRVRIP